MRALAVATAFLLLVGCVDADAPVHPGDDAERVLEIAPGASASGLATRLESEGLVPSAFAWKWFLRGEQAGCVKAGRHAVQGSMSMRELLAELCGPPLPEDVPFTVVEGWRIVDTDAALAAKGWIAPGAYAAVATGKTVAAPFEVTGPTYEGYLFPETYRVVPDGFDPAAFVERQLATFHERFVVPHGGDLGDRTLHDVVVVASMLEREEPVPAQRRVVAGVIWKRLDAGWNLGIDATSRYLLADWNDRGAFLARLRDPSDPYNTRLRQGLPPTAIGSPGLVSLDAAVTPEASSFWYYLHDAKGTFHGGRDAAEHEANRRRFNVY